MLTCTSGALQRLNYVRAVLCGQWHTMGHVVDSCPVTQLDGGLTRLHEADDDDSQLAENHGGISTRQMK